MSVKHCLKEDYEPVKLIKKEENQAKPEKTKLKTLFLKFLRKNND